MPVFQLKNFLDQQENVKFFAQYGFDYRIRNPV